SVIGTGPGPTTPAGAAWASRSSSPVPSTPLEIPTPCMKPRREKPDLGLAGSSGSFLELTDTFLSCPYDEVDVVRSREKSYQSLRGGGVAVGSRVFGCDQSVGDEESWIRVECETKPIESLKNGRGQPLLGKGKIYQTNPF